jgi:hypothetical protein
MKEHSAGFAGTILIFVVAISILSTPRARAEDWRHIGSAHAGKSRDKDKISVNRNYSELKFKVDDIGIVFHKVTVVFDDGKEGPWPVLPFIANGSESGVYRVKHGRKIKSVVFDYETRNSMNPLAWGKVDLYGR